MKGTEWQRVVVSMATLTLIRNWEEVGWNGTGEVNG